MPHFTALQFGILLHFFDGRHIDEQPVGYGRYAIILNTPLSSLGGNPTNLSVAQDDPKFRVERLPESRARTHGSDKLTPVVGVNGLREVLQGDERLCRKIE
jgi:hypothetical protein